MKNLERSLMFAGGLLFGTVGLKLLSSRGAKKIYAHTTAAAIRAKECVMTDVTRLREGCDDILADAKDINEQIAVDAACEEIYDEDLSDAEESSEE